MPKAAVNPPGPPGPPSTLGEATRQIVAWMGGVVPGCAVATGAESGSAGLLCLLRGLSTAPPRLGGPGARPPLAIQAHFVLAARGTDPAAHDRLGELAFALQAGKPVLPESSEPDPETPPPAWWQAHGLPPLPALGLRLLVLRARPDPLPGIVLEPLVLHQATRRQIHGRLRTAAGHPLVGVPVSGAGEPVRTGHDGGFTLSFAGVPAPTRLTADVRGRLVPLDLPDPLPTRLDLTVPDP